MRWLEHTHHVVVPKPVLPAVNYEMAGAHTMWWCQNQRYLQWTMRWLGHTPCGGAKTSVTCSELWDGWGTHHVVVPKPVLPAVNYEMAGAHTMWWCQNQRYLQWTMRWLEHTPCGGAKTSVTCNELWDGWGTHHVHWITFCRVKCKFTLKSRPGKKCWIWEVCIWRENSHCQIKKFIRNGWKSGPTCWEIESASQDKTFFFQTRNILSFRLFL